jgi:hypothetical protein
MARNTQKPDEHVRDDGTRVLSHPAFGQIRLSRASGRQALYGSDFEHQHFVILEICGSELHRSLSNDWHHQTRHKIEINMSEAQWATFVSSMGQGGGVPCTISYDHEGMKPGITLPDRREQFKGEADEVTARAVKALEQLDAELEGMSLPKGKTAAIRSSLTTARRALDNALPFVADQFSEHIERTVEKAKVEIHGYMGHVMQCHGLAHMQDQAPLLIEAPQDDESEPS